MIGASSLLSPCVPAEGTYRVSIPLLSLLGRRTHLGRALGRRRSITQVFLWDGSKDSLGFGGLWQTAWGPLKAVALRGGERIKPGSQRRLFIKCERRQSGFKINFIPFFSYSLLWGVQDAANVLIWMERLELRTMYCWDVWWLTYYHGPWYYTVLCNWAKTSYYSFQQYNIPQC